MEEGAESQTSTPKPNVLPLGTAWLSRTYSFLSNMQRQLYLPTHTCARLSFLLEPLHLLQNWLHGLATIPTTGAPRAACAKELDSNCTKRLPDSLMLRFNGR